MFEDIYSPYTKSFLQNDPKVINVPGSSDAVFPMFIDCVLAFEPIRNAKNNSFSETIHICEKTPNQYLSDFCLPPLTMWVLLAFDFGRLSIEYLLSLAQFAVAKNFRCSLIVYLPSNQLETQNTILFVQ